MWSKSELPESPSARADPILVALEHIARTGGLQGYAATRSQSLALMTVNLRRKLVGWNCWRARYEPTRSGRRLMAGYRAAPPASRRTVSGGAPAGWRMAVAGAVSAVVACLAIAAGPRLSPKIDQPAAILAVTAGQQLQSPAPLDLPVVAYDEGDPAPAAQAEVVRGPSPAAEAPARQMERQKVQKPSKPGRKTAKKSRKPVRPRAIAAQPSRHWNPCALGCVSSWN